MERSFRPIKRLRWQIDAIANRFLSVIRSGTLLELGPIPAREPDSTHYGSEIQREEGISVHDRRSLDLFSKRRFALSRDRDAT
jgi:hypothetical protein